MYPVLSICSAWGPDELPIWADLTSVSPTHALPSATRKASLKPVRLSAHIYLQGQYESPSNTSTQYSVLQMVSECVTHLSTFFTLRSSSDADPARKILFWNDHLGRRRSLTFDEHSVMEFQHQLLAVHSLIRHNPVWGDTYHSWRLTATRAGGNEV
jgi:hypothetical protein